ncbi:MAG: lipoyl(octanoyl) transferase LipB [Deltaproteobacteria bacterium]|nr:lipoyl(octanoyl) transferase LipB [Deltaproteobacteria bacterium]
MAIDLPITDYTTVWNIQKRLAGLKREGLVENDFLIFTQHFPVFTIGKNGKKENLLISSKKLTERGIKIILIERGGDITYHGPGQLIAYPIVDLKKNRLSVKEYVNKLEELLIRTSSDMGASASSVENAVGAWVDFKKIGSVGIAVKKDIAFHGIALNINIDLTPFNWINPCGLKGVSATSVFLESEKNNINIIFAKSIMRKYIKEVFCVELQPYTPDTFVNEKF